MKNFHIFSNEENNAQPEAHLFEVGTRLTFRQVGEQIKASISIPVICL